MSYVTQLVSAQHYTPALSEQRLPIPTTSKPARKSLRDT
jgi:hypothetical protein